MQTDIADFGPDLEFLGPGSSVLGGSDMIAAKMEEVVDLVVGREEPLRLAGVVRLTYRDEKSPKQGRAIKLRRLHSAIRSPPRLGRSAALIARRDGVEG